MTKIKLCGLRRLEDIETANLLKPDYIGFVFAKKSKRYISPEEATVLKKRLEEVNALYKQEISESKDNQNNSKLENVIKAVGVFVNEEVEKVAELLNTGIIDLAQLHGSEDEEYISRLRNLTDKPIIQAFKIEKKEDLIKAEKSTADHILLDAGAGDGMVFNWELLKGFERPYFLAGGLNPQNVGEAVRKLNPYGVDVSSGIETDGFKDPVKMQKFVETVGRYAQYST